MQRHVAVAGGRPIRTARNLQRTSQNKSATVDEGHDRTVESVMAAASLRALLEHSVDYAGLFPPANLALEPALHNHAQYIRAPDAWMLGAFVLPVTEFDAATAALARFDPKYRLRVSALGSKTPDAAAFLAALGATKAAINAFSIQYRETISVRQLEMALPNDADAGTLAKSREIAPDIDAFWEAAPDAAEATIELIAQNNSSGAGRAFGYKLRTGGVKADAFPSASQIARALAAAARHRVPIKFTAGLHHPVRQFHQSVETKMHGFLNVLGAGVLAAEHGWDERQTAAMLEEESAGAFSFQDDFFAWREWKIATERIAIRRRLVTSFGSCSFDEPREDLRAMKLL
jgi:hypothetical protein